MLRNSLWALATALTVSFPANAQLFSSTRPLEESLLFHPKTAGESWSQAPNAVDVWLNSAAGNRIHAWWFPQPGSKGAVLYCHGNAGNLSYHWPLANKLRAALKQSVLLFDYPGYGKSSGQPSESGCYAAAQAAMDWLLREQNIHPRRVVLIGESLGGGVATELALRQPPMALVLIRTFTSVPDMARKNLVSSAAAPLVRNKFDNLSRVPKCAAPIFIAHGNRDTLIPLAQPIKLYEAAPEPKRAFLLKNLGHNDALPADFFTALAAFVQEYEPPPAQPPRR